MIVAPRCSSEMLARSAAGFIATSTFGASPGVRMSREAKWIWNADTPASVPAGARISAGKFGSVARSLPITALAFLDGLAHTGTSVFVRVTCCQPLVKPILPLGVVGPFRSCPPCDADNLPGRRPRSRSERRAGVVAVDVPVAQHRRALAADLVAGPAREHEPGDRPLAALVVAVHEVDVQRPA